MAAGETVLVNTVDQNISKYSEHDYTRDLLAQNIQYKIALPIHRHLLKIIEDKVQMLNCPLNCDDVRVAEDIWEKKPGMPERKNPKKKNSTNQRGNLTVPTTILERYKSVTLAGDIMFINRICFINTISRHVKFMTSEHIANAEASTLQESTRQVKQV